MHPARRQECMRNLRYAECLSVPRANQQHTLVCNEFFRLSLEERDIRWILEVSALAGPMSAECIGALAEDIPEILEPAMAVAIAFDIPELAGALDRLAPPKRSPTWSSRGIVVVALECDGPVSTVKLTDTSSEAYPAGWGVSFRASGAAMVVSRDTADIIVDLLERARDYQRLAGQQ